MAEPTTIQELWDLTSGPSGVDRERLKELVDTLLDDSELKLTLYSAHS